MKVFDRLFNTISLERHTRAVLKIKELREEVKNSDNKYQKIYARNRKALNLIEKFSKTGDSDDLLYSLEKVLKGK